MKGVMCMGWLLSIVMLICCMVQFDGYFLLTAGLFAIAGSIEYMAAKISKIGSRQE